MLNLAGFGPRGQGLGLDFHPGACGSGPKLGVLSSCAERFLDRTGYFNRQVEVEVEDRARRTELTIWVGRLAGRLELAICL